MSTYISASAAPRSVSTVESGSLIVDPTEMPIETSRGTDLEGLAHHLVEPRRERLALVGSETRAHEHELVTTDAAEPIGLPHRPTGTRDDLDEQLVAERVPVTVVDGLEAIEVHEEETDRDLGVPRDRQLLSDEANRVPTVGKPGERIVIGHGLEPLARAAFDWSC